MLAYFLMLSGVLELWWLPILPCRALHLVVHQFVDLCQMLGGLHGWVFAILSAAFHVKYAIVSQSYHLYSRSPMQTVITFFL